MKSAPVPINEKARLEALSRYKILDTPAEAVFDVLTQLAADICSTPVAAITLIDEDREWYKSRIGIEDKQAPRNISFCAHTILQDDLMIIPDTFKDERFINNPFVLEDPPLRFYAGAPMTNSEGHTVGTLCVVDHVPRQLTNDQKKTLKILASHAMTQLELRYVKIEQSKASVAYADSENRYKYLVEHMIDGLAILDEHGCTTFVNNCFCEMTGYSRDEIVDRPASNFMDETNRAVLKLQLQERRKGKAEAYEISFTHKDGHQVHTTLSSQPIFDNEGKFKGSFAIVADITSRKQAEKSLKQLNAELEQRVEQRTAELRKSEKKISRAIETSPDAIVITRLSDGKILEVNQRFTRISGYTKEETINKSTFDLALWDRPKECMLFLEKLKKTGTIIEEELELVRKNGQHSFVLMSAILQEFNGEQCVFSIHHDITERKQAEQSLHNLIEGFSVTSGKEFFRSLTKHIGDTLDMDYVVVAELVQGRDDIIHSVEVYHRGEYLDPLEYSLKGTPCMQVIGKTVKGHASGIQQAFPDFPLLTTLNIEGYVGSPLFDSRDQPLGLIAVLNCKPISNVKHIESLLKIFAIRSAAELERKQMEETLRESNERLHGVLDATHAGTWRVDLRTGSDTRDDSLNKLLGLPAELSTQPVEDWFSYAHPDDVNSIRLAWEKGMESGLYEVEHRLIRRDGQILWVYDRGHIVRDDEGQLQYAIGAVIDITERKQAQESLRQSEKQLRLITESIPANITYVNAGQIYCYYNAAFARNFLQSGKTIIGMHMMEVMSEENYEVVRPYIEEGLAGRQVNFEFNILKNNGRIKSVFDISYVPHFDSDGKVLGLYMLSIDITERIQAQKKIKQSHMALRKLAAQLNATREEERTVIARDIHDELGQSLTALKIDLSWLLTHLPKTWKKLPERTRKMIELVDSNLDYVRKLSSELRPAILDDLGLGAAIEWQLDESARLSNYQHKLVLSDPELKIDSNYATVVFRIFQAALTNITRHAQATFVEVSLRKIDSKLELTVKDNGIGINRRHITSSSSIGLIGMRERAEEYGGNLSIDLAKEGGTVLTLNLPISENIVT